MRFKPLFLYSNQLIGEDELFNPIYDLVEFKETTGRFTKWTEKEVALDVRNVTTTSRKILTRELQANLLKASRIEFEGKFHNIKEIIGDDTDRWRILVVDRYGSDEP